jgi:two-component system chemotaxis response regulator CheB
VARRDIIVIGASAGGVEPLRSIVEDLRPDLPASIFIVLHLSNARPSMLAEILDRASPLPAAFASEGARIEPGTITVAIPDHHLVLDDGQMHVTHGPAENRHRPSVDVLFRSAARSYGARVIGVVLSGVLDDGTAGLIAIKVRGGLAVIQDPSEAFAADMPRNAMRYIEVDAVLPSREIGRKLNELVMQRVESDQAAPATLEMIEENRIASLIASQTDDEDKPGVPSSIACPDCHGVLWEIQEGDLLRWRCRTGHAYSPETLIAAENGNVDKALWEAIRVLEERAALRKRLIGQARERHLPTLEKHFTHEVSETEHTVKMLRGLLSKHVEAPQAEHQD